MKQLFSGLLSRAVVPNWGVHRRISGTHGLYMHKMISKIAKCQTMCHGGLACKSQTWEQL